MDTNSPTPDKSIGTGGDRPHRSKLELWFAELGLEVTEVERCPDWSCELCAGAEPRPIEASAASSAAEAA